jgi:2-hydroxychromene-2-carboxylate isomerase
MTLVSDIKKNIMPYAARFLSSDKVLNAKRYIAEIKRKVQGKRHELSVFIAGNDPHSYLLIQVLPELVQRFGLRVNIYTIRDFQEDMYPDFERWKVNGLVDANRLAELYELQLPKTSDAQKVNSAEPSSITWQLLQVEKSDDAISKVRSILDDFWASKPSLTKPTHSLDKQLSDNQERLKRLGHYYPAMVHYGGEWYWGIDRLDHLERRLNSLGLSYDDERVKYDLQTRLFCSKPQVKIENNTPLELFFSARSPYSYIGLLQAEKLARHYCIPFKVKLLLPMMMRGMFVPDTKKMYIFHDTKREAKKMGIAYGFVADPLGEAVTNCYSLYPYAESQGKGVEFLLSFSKAVNSQGIRADREEGLQVIVERCDLNWHEAKLHLGNEDWRVSVEKNFEELQMLGLWGVPCFRYGDVVTWGQDRLWLIEQAILKASL